METGKGIQIVSNFHNTTQEKKDIFMQAAVITLNFPSWIKTTHIPITLGQNLGGIGFDPSSFIQPNVRSDRLIRSEVI